MWTNHEYPEADFFAEPLNNLGFAYWSIKDYEQAEIVLMECKDYFPNRAIVYLNLGDLFRDLENKEQAVYHYNAFLESRAGTPEQNQRVQEELKKLN